MYARPIPAHTKVHFEILQFLAVMYDMGVLICAFEAVETAVFFSLFKQFLKIEMTWRQPIIVRECIFFESQN